MEIKLKNNDKLTKRKKSLVLDLILGTMGTYVVLGALYLIASSVY